MRLQKFAAFTIVFGWYLMVPPADPRAPLNQWTRAAFFDTARECKAKRYNDISRALKNQSTSQALNVQETDVVQKARNSKCIPSDAVK
jgi:hypothetical protein